MLLGVLALHLVLNVIVSRRADRLTAAPESLTKLVTEFHSAEGPQRLPESKFLHVTILVTPFDLIDHLLLRRTIEATYEVHDSDFLPWSSERRIAKIRVSLFGEQVVPVLE